jgi:hypothetical protein
VTSGLGNNYPILLAVLRLVGGGTSLIVVLVDCLERDVLRFLCWTCALAAILNGAP